MEKEKVKLDEVLKFLFSTSNKVLVKLLNGIFNENFSVDEVELTVSNNEFVEDDLGILRGDKRVTSSLSRTPGGFKNFQWQAYVKA